jgi:hypothetical protein
MDNGMFDDLGKCLAALCVICAVAGSAAGCAVCWLAHHLQIIVAWH